jgi:hypothetical protein
MNFYNPNVIFEGIVQLENDPSADNHAARKSWIEQNAIMAIHTDSSLLAETQVVNGQKQLKLKSLLLLMFKLILQLLLCLPGLLLTTLEQKSKKGI